MEAVEVQHSEKCIKVLGKDIRFLLPLRPKTNLAFKSNGASAAPVEATSLTDQTRPAAHSQVDGQQALHCDFIQSVRGIHANWATLLHPTAQLGGTG